MTSFAAAGAKPTLPSSGSPSTRACTATSGTFSQRRVQLRDGRSADRVGTGQTHGANDLLTSRWFDGRHPAPTRHVQRGWRGAEPERTSSGARRRT